MTKTERWLLGFIDGIGGPYEVRVAREVNAATALVRAGFLALAERGGNWVECTPEGSKRGERIRIANGRKADRTALARGELRQDQQIERRLLVRGHRLGAHTHASAALAERANEAALSRLRIAGLVAVWRIPNAQGVVERRYCLTREGAPIAARFSEEAARAAAGGAGAFALPPSVAVELRGAAWPEWGPAAVRCPACGCDPTKPCAIVFDGGEGRCVPAGVFEVPTCSRCAA